MRAIPNTHPLPVDDVPVEAWCRTCALPSALTARMLVVKCPSHRVVTKALAGRCMECGGTDIDWPDGWLGWVVIGPGREN